MDRGEAPHLKLHETPANNSDNDAATHCIKLNITRPLTKENNYLLLQFKEVEHETKAVVKILHNSQ
jgi:hypothetical protein